MTVTSIACDNLAIRGACACAPFVGAAIMTASGCPCSKLRAAPFMFLLTASELVLAVRLRFGARTPCCGHGLDHRRRQSHRRSNEFQQLNNQVHGQITSFRKRRRCQHTRLTPLALHDCTTNTRTNVPNIGIDYDWLSERRCRGAMTFVGASPFCGRRAENAPLSGARAWEGRVRIQWRATCT